LFVTARLIDRRELKISVSNGYLAGPIVLPFVVETVLTIERSPIRRIERRAIEFVVPEELPAGDVWYLGSDASRWRHKHNQYRRNANAITKGLSEFQHSRFGSDSCYRGLAEESA
jgi:hypothetical protein